ncbi:MAG: 4Fe-4S binding protein [Candidatus Muirbacterium halophilum]|nr:4Fe-4S binding protein [Candidatus Muirbacterium halophilum]MCK9475185.1 4Fe-4S binding protein [Candidatus Muirbacterium halophilum]
MADLKVEILGMKFKNPVMPAAGPNVWDGDRMILAAKNGAGGIVAKTVSVIPAKVPHPNIAKTVAGGLLNAELWSEEPWEKFVATEYKKAKSTGLPLIASVGYGKDDLAKLGPEIAKTGYVDAIEFSIHYLGKDITPVVESAKALKQGTNLPVIAKISPNVPDIAELVKAIDPYIDALVAVNSLGPALDFDPEDVTPFLDSENGFGWMSGKAIMPLALRCVYEIRQVFNKPIFGVGGIETGEDAIKFMMAGASAVQICSIVIKEGHKAYGRIAQEMSDWLDKHGYDSVNDVKDLYFNKMQKKKTIRYNVVVPELIDEKKCISCGKCEKSCMHGAITMTQSENGKIPVYDEAICLGCGYCTTVCPVKVLKIK